MIDNYLIPLIKILFVLNATLIGVTYMVLLCAAPVSPRTFAKTSHTQPTTR